MAAEAAGFWSYVRKDNEGDHGRILALAEDLREQYRIRTAEELELFIDRDSIQWGEAWEQRISTAIAGTTFFIAIITPSYFKSQACRQELLKFVREAERLGLTKLLMPVYWVEVPELEEDPEQSADEAVRVVAKYNWQDLREESFEDRDSSAYRKAVRALAEELAKRAKVARTVEDVPASPEPHDIAPSLPPDEHGSQADELGLLDKLVGTEEALPVATGLIEEIGAQMEIINTKLEKAGDDLKAATARGNMKAALTATNRLAHELTEPASKVDEAGHEYGKALAELDQGVHAQLDVIEGFDKDERPAEQQVNLEQIVDLVGVAEEMAKGFEEMLTGIEPAAALSRSLRAPLDNLKSGILGLLDGNAVISEWGYRATKLLDEESQEDEAPAGATEGDGS